MEGPWRRADRVGVEIGRDGWRRRSERRSRERRWSERPNFSLAEHPPVGVEDLQLDPAAGRPEPVLRHRHRRLLADDVPSEADPGTPLKLQAQAGDLGQRFMNRLGEVRRLEDDETGADAAGVRRQPTNDRLLAPRQARGQVDHQQVDRSTREERTRERESLGRIGRAQDDQPAQVDAPADRLEGVERAGQVEERDDRAGCLRLCHATEGERRLAARGAPADRRARLAGQAPGAKDRIEGREAGRDDVIRARRERVRMRLRRERVWRRLRREWVEGGRQRPFSSRSGACGLQLGRGLRPHARPISEPDRRASPARFQVREGGPEGVVRH